MDIFKREIESVLLAAYCKEDLPGIILHLKIKGLARM